MKRTLAAVTVFALMMMQISTLSAGAGSLGVITGSMQGPAGQVAGVRVNALNRMGAIVGSAVTNGTGSYTLEGLPAGTFVVQAVSAAGTVMSTSSATLSAASMKATTNLTASASAAPAAQAAAVQNGGLSPKAIWWIVGASAATTGVIAAVALNDDSSPSN
jgi:hypothetical protein